MVSNVLIRRARKQGQVHDLDDLTGKYGTVNNLKTPKAVLQCYMLNR